MATALSDYAFTSNLINFQCPTHYSGWLCTPPDACAHDATTGRVYCCKQEESRCWTIPTDCSNDGSTLGCKNNGVTWCCVNDRENCITDAGRYNLCFSKASDVLSNLSAEELNATYSSLSSSSPSASSYTFNPTKSGSQTTSSPSTTSATTTTENPASTSSGQSRETIVVGSGSHSPSTSLPGGAIGGIVAGVIVALIIALGALYFFLKRNRSQPNPAVGAYPPGPTYTAPPPDRILAAEGKSASSEIAPSKPIYKTGYTKHAYEADTRQTYEADGNVVTQVHEAGGLNRHELAGR